MIDAILHYTFMQNAFIAALLASIVAGILGTIAIEKQLISMSGGIAHASFGGIGLGYLLGFEPLWGGMLFATGSSLVILNLSKKDMKINPDTMIGILWSFGMALGILFISLSPGYMPDMTSYLFGNILSVSTSSILYMTVFTAIVVLLFLVLFHYITLYLFDDEYAAIRGVNVKLLNAVIYIMIPVGIIVLIKIVGIILTIALMTIPVSIAKLFFNSIGKVILGSVLIGLLLNIIGLTVSYYLSIPSGACIIIISAIVYLAVSVIKKNLPKWLHTRKEHA